MANQVIATPAFDLDEPGTFLFTPERAFFGRHLTACCLSLRDGDNRTAFLADERAYLRGYGLSEEEQGLVLARDWTELMRRGAHLQAVSKVVATLGGNLFDLSAQTLGVTVRELKDACPRRVSGVPEGAAWPA